VGPGTPAAHARERPAGIKESDILTELAPQPDDVIVIKSRHSGFYNTNLHTILKELGITTLVFTGGTTRICVESTLRDAYFRDYRCLLLADCTAEPIDSRLPRTNHEATLLLVELVYGWVSESASLMQALTETHIAADVAQPGAEHSVIEPIEYRLAGTGHATSTFLTSNDAPKASSDDRSAAGPIGRRLPRAIPPPGS